MRRTFDNLECPRGVAAADHAAQCLTDVLYRPGVIGDMAAVACVYDDALDHIPRDFYIRPDELTA